MTPAVYHRRDKLSAGAVYVGRPSPWGNPFVIGKDGTRAEVLAKFREYAVERMASEPEWLAPLAGRNLACWCKPKECHGDVLMELANKAGSRADPVSPL